MELNAKCSKGRSSSWISTPSAISWKSPAPSTCPARGRSSPTWTASTRFARSQGIPVLATACCHSADDPELYQFPPHCMAGTDGQRRVPETADPDSVVLGAGDRADGHPPATLDPQKQEFDVFSRPDADDLIARYNQSAPTFVVYGVATDYCVRAAVEGLLARQLPRRRGRRRGPGHRSGRREPNC